VENNKGLGSRAVLKKFLAAKLQEGPSPAAGQSQVRLKVLGGGAAAAHKPETRQEREKAEAREDELSDCEPFCSGFLNLPIRVVEIDAVRVFIARIALDDFATVPLAAVEAGLDPLANLGGLGHRPGLVRVPMLALSVRINPRGEPALVYGIEPARQGPGGGPGGGWAGPPLLSINEPSVVPCSKQETLPPLKNMTLPPHAGSCGAPLPQSHAVPPHSLLWYEEASGIPLNALTLLPTLPAQDHRANSS